MVQRQRCKDLLYTGVGKKEVAETVGGSVRTVERVIVVSCNSGTIARKQGSGGHILYQPAADN